MGVLQDFERRLEGAVEGFFARAFKSGLQPVDLAKAVRRYAEDQRLVAEDGVVVPNVYRLRISTADAERLRTYGDQLPEELATVVRRTAEERDWELRGPARVLLEPDSQVRTGRYEIAGRVESAATAHAHDAAESPAPPDPNATVVEPTTDSEPSPTGGPRLEGDGIGLSLRGTRLSVGRHPGCDLVLEDPTVSREHAAIVQRAGAWWVLDLGSTNGTRVDGVQAAELPLSDGAAVAFGDAVLHYREA